MSFIVYVTTKIIVPYKNKLPFFEFVILAVSEYNTQLLSLQDRAYVFMAERVHLVWNPHW